MKRATLKLRSNRKGEGKCVDCGKELDRSGVRCSICNDKQNSYNREVSAWLREHRICPRCRKNDLLGDECSCPECRAKAANYKAINKERDKDRRKRDQRKNYENRRARFESDENVCNRCGKPKNDSRYKLCPICRAKGREIDHRRRPQTLGYQKERYKIGLCYFCNEPILPGKKVCRNHYDKIVYMNQHKSKEAKKWGEFKIR